MKIVVLGATGATGKYVVAQALALRHQVVAFVRDAARLHQKNRAGLTVVEASLEDTGALDLAMEGAGAVVSALGVSRRTPQSSPARSLARVFDAMERNRIRRYVGASIEGLTLPGEHKDFGGRVTTFLARTFTPAVYADKAYELKLLGERELAWVLVRAPMAVDRSGTGTYRLAIEKPPGKKIARGDLAAALLEQLTSDQYLRQAPYVANP